MFTDVYLSRNSGDLSNNIYYIRIDARACVLRYIHGIHVVRAIAKLAFTYSLRFTFRTDRMASILSK